MHKCFEIIELILGLSCVDIIDMSINKRKIRMFFEVLKILGIEVLADGLVPADLVKEKLCNLKPDKGCNISINF